MPRKRKPLDQHLLLEAKLSELAALVKEHSTYAHVEISLARYEDEDAAIDVYPPPNFSVEEASRLEVTVGERCNEILLETGLFIIGAVRN